MNEDIGSLSRQQLYNLVWSIPIVHLQDHFGLTNKTITHRCWKRNVPVPPVGYWLKVRNGHDAEKPPLPEDATPTRARVRPSRAKSREIKIKVSEKLIKPTSLVEQARTELTSMIHKEKEARALARKRGWGSAIPSETYTWRYVRTSGECLNRALRILNAVVMHLVRIGASVEWSEKRPDHLLVHIGDASAHFRIEEVMVRKRKTPTSSQQPVATGRLRLVIDAGWYFFGGPKVRRSWSDGKRQNLEDILDDFVDGLGRTAEFIKQKKEERERREELVQQENQEGTDRELAAASIRIADEKAARLKHQKEQHLLNVLSKWNEAQELRVFLDRCSEKLKSAGLSMGEVRDIQAWLHWAKEFAEEIDPLNSLDRLVPPQGIDG